MNLDQKPFAFSENLSRNLIEEALTLLNGFPWISSNGIAFSNKSTDGELVVN
jgi:hypothetical protein